MKKAYFFLTLGLTLFSVAAAAAVLEPISACAAFSRYQTRPKTELSKLIYLLERFNLPGVEIKIDGNIYQAQKTFPFGKFYLSLNYHQERADMWLRMYCYRSPFGNQVMLFRLPGEDFQTARDFLLKELKELERVEKKLASPPLCEVKPKHAEPAA